MRDVANGIVEALKVKGTEGKIIELAGPKVYTCGALAGSSCSVSAVRGELLPWHDQTSLTAL